MTFPEPSELAQLIAFAIVLRVLGMFFN
jgi:hypothetical protein